MATPTHTHQLSLLSEQDRRSTSDLQRVVVERRPIAVDLFAGIGGLSLGFEQAGFDVVASVEYDPVHAAVHAYNFPHTTVLCRDISRLSVEELNEAIRQGCRQHGHSIVDTQQEVDVVFGGPPCQGFSTMGKRLIDDKRNQLVFHFFRIIDELRPRYFVMENVPGMAAGGHSSILTQLIDEFERAGYEVARPARILNAADYGVPQDRRRLILLGTRRGEIAPHYPMPNVRRVAKRSGGAGSGSPTVTTMQQSMPNGPTVMDALGDLPDLDTFPELLGTDQVVLPDALVESMERQASCYARRLRGTCPDEGDFSYPRNWDRRLLTSSLRTVHTSVSIRRFADTKPGETEPISRFYRLDGAGLSNTLRAGTGSERGAYTSPRPIHPTLPRVISVREAARLHSFPDWFRIHATKWHGMRQIGNSVPPLLGRAIAMELLASLGVAPIRPQMIVTGGATRLLYLNMSTAAAHFGAASDCIPQPRQRDKSPTKELVK